VYSAEVQTVIKWLMSYPRWFLTSAELKNRIEGLGKNRPAAEEGLSERVRLFKNVAMWSASGRFPVSSFRS